MMQDICCIIVTYNRKELLYQCLQSLFHQTYSHFDILIIDNKSTDGTHEYISEFIDDNKVKYINTNENLGGAGGFNFGLKTIYNNYKFAWIMDDDTIPDHDCLENLVLAAKCCNNDFGFLSSLAYKETELCYMNNQVLLSKNSVESVYAKNSEMLYIKSASFVSLFLNLKYIDFVGFPQKEFFVWGDDLEYTQRISKITKNNFLILNSHAQHLMKFNYSDTLTDENDKNRIGRFYRTFRNSFCIAKRQGLKGILTFHGNMIKRFFKFLFKSRKYKLKKIWSLIRGYFCGLFFNPKIEYIKDIESDR